MNNNIEIKNISKHYEGFKLKDISLTVPKGSIVGLIGENGAGKTTIIKMILNLIKKDTGEIKVFNKDNIKHEKFIKENIGVVLDDSFFTDYLTANDVSLIMKQLYKNWDNKLFKNYLKDMNIPLNKRIKDFSSGMKMKLRIISALSHNPKLLILDEPTSGLDPIVRNEILDIFRNFIQDEEKSILLSSHITTDLEHIADYIVFIHEGKIIMSNTTEELLDEFGIAKCSKEEFEKIDKNDYFKYQKNKYSYEVLVNNKKKFRSKYKNITIDKPSIEDIMLICIRGEK